MSAMSTRCSGVKKTVIECVSMTVFLVDIADAECVQQRSDKSGVLSFPSLFP